MSKKLENIKATGYSAEKEAGHSCSLGKLKVRVKRNPASISPPTKAKPRAKLARSPIIPIQVGIEPAPIRKAKGIARETATFRDLGGPMQERAAKPAGKKQTANMGCMKTMITSQ